MLFPHKAKRKINIEYLCDRGNAKDKIIIHLGFRMC